MSARYSQKANLLAGGFLLGGVALAVATSFVLADVNLTRMSEYEIRFSIKDGATGLSPDAPVRVGGQNVGKVRSVRVTKDETGEWEVLATIRIRADIDLYEDAWAYLEVPLLGTASTINIPYLGTGSEVTQAQGQSPRLEPGETLQGSIAPPAFLANAGFGPDQREQLKRMFTQTERSLSELTKTLEGIRPHVEPVATDIEATAASARRSMESIEGNLTTWRSDISTTLSNAQTASAKFPELTDDAKIVLADAKEMIKSGRAVVDDNRPRIDNIFANADRIVARVDTEWVPRGSELLDQAREGVAQFESVGRTVNELAAEQRPGIENTLANLRTASDQLKFLAIEARSQPWRLLHRPDTKELENQLLYDSARSYAMAVGDLRAASEAMDALVARTQNTGEVNLGEMQAMRAKLQEAFEGYAKAEADLLDRMMKANR
ncbi:MAG: MCE family protein [Phycisphaerales bacterium]|nr:MCE family protein [Phycisphaerales bacterium]